MAHTFRGSTQYIYNLTLFFDKKWGQYAAADVFQPLCVWTTEIGDWENNNIEISSSWWAILTRRATVSQRRKENNNEAIKVNFSNIEMLYSYTTHAPIKAQKWSIYTQLNVLFIVEYILYRFHVYLPNWFFKLMILH